MSYAIREIRTGQPRIVSAGTVDLIGSNQAWYSVEQVISIFKYRCFCVI